MRRRAAFGGGLRLVAAWGALALPGAATWALPRRPLVFPRDFGSHPELRTEWWYITGHAESGARRFGFQVTFFRSRIDAAQPLHSAFAAKQLVWAHTALTDLQGGRLHHDQRMARAGFGVAQAAEADTDVRLRDWTLRRADGRYQARVASDDFALAFDFTPTQPVLLQGDDGLSRKGPGPAQASYYYSEPQLATRGRITLQGQAFEVTGKAWLDHEFSEELIPPEAVGWDWIGFNLDDGGALAAFVLRRADGSDIWASGTFRGADGTRQVFGTDQVRFTPLDSWTSPRTRARYPVRWKVETPAGRFEVRALLDDQELAGSGPGSVVYWEGLSELLDVSGKRVGLGYLEMTGYAAPLDK